MRIEFTKEMNNKLIEYQQEHFLTLEGIMEKAKLSPDAYFRFKRRKIIGIQSLRKIKENLNIDLLKESKEN